MTEIFLNINLAILILISLAIVLTGTIRKAVILTGILSISASFIYLLLSSPDIALAQVVIGSTLSTIILVIGIKKSKVFTIFYIKKDNNFNNTIVNSVEKSLFSKDLDPHIIYTSRDKMFLKNNYEFEMLIRERNDKVEIYGEESNSLFVEVLDNIKKELPENQIVLKEIYTMKEDDYEEDTE